MEYKLKISPSNEKKLKKSTHLSSLQISSIQTLIAVSNEPIENPLIAAKTNTKFIEVQWGIKAKVIPINVTKNTKANCRLMYLKRKPPKVEKKDWDLN